MTTDQDRRKLLYKIAKAYFEEGLTQRQIGLRLGLSRIKVSRLLQQARDERIVQITITPRSSSSRRTPRSGMATGSGDGTTRRHPSPSRPMAQPRGPAMVRASGRVPQISVVLGPAADGGYYAISCRRTHPGMFDGVEWSGPRALQGTVRAARQCGLTVTLGDTWFDIDTPDDLVRLARSPSLPPRTAAWLEKRRRDVLGTGHCD